MPTYDARRWMGYLSGAMADAGIRGPADLCRRAGISPSVVSRWEGDDRQPSNRILRKLAPALGVSVRTLLVEAGHFEEHELVGGDDALMEILSSEILTDKQKLTLIREWRREEREREFRLVKFIQELVTRQGKGSTESSTLP